METKICKSIEQLRELCRGCKSYEDPGLSCNIFPFLGEYINWGFEQEFRCPCSTCLIKAMCDDGCLEHIDYANTVQLEEEYFSNLLKERERDCYDIDT